MNVRRYIARLPKPVKPSISASDSASHVVTRANLEELIFNKNNKNRETCLNLFNELSKTKYFSCLVEGEKEIVLLTDCILIEKLKKISKLVSYHTIGLGYISVDFSIKLREVVGIYGVVTSALASANISIHSFHTIGGEILILVKNEDLIKAQEVIISTLKMIS
jgi:aspartokinase